MKRRITALALCAALLLCAGACSSLGEGGSSPDSTPSSSVVESSPTPTPSPIPTPSPAPSPTPETETEEPSAAEEDPEFEEAFDLNPIDAQMNQDMATAASASAIQKVYSSAVTRWERFIGTLCAQGEETLTGEALAQFQDAQKAWEEGLDDALQAAQEENPDDAISAARAATEVYRAQAKALCQLLYEATGSMPEFPAIDGQAAG
ncbi:MAG: hypothetical protein ACLTOU_12190 [Acutalibacter sp.]